MKKVLKTTPLLAVAGLAGFVLRQMVVTKRMIRTGRDLAVKTIPFSRINPRADIRILLIGDSTVVGAGAEDPKRSIAGYIAADYPDAEIINKGINGLRTHELIPLLAMLQGQHFHLCIIHTGANDIVRFTKLDELQRDIRTVLRLTKNISDDVILVQVGNLGSAKILPFGTRWIFRRRTQRVRTMFYEAAKEYSAHFIDLFTIEHTFDHFAIDYFHPNGNGYAVWYKYLKDGLKQIPILSKRANR